MADDLKVEVTDLGPSLDPRERANSDFPGVHSGGIANHLYPQPQIIPPFNLYEVSGVVAAEQDAQRGITQTAGLRPKNVLALRRNRRDALILKRQIERQTPPRL